MRVELSLAARADLGTYDGWLRREAGADIADHWLDELIGWLAELGDFPHMGRPRPDLGAGLRTRVFRRSVIVAYAVGGETVTVFGIFARGRNVTPDLFDPR